ncbi:F-box protein SKIP23-like [Silene latifolia]|uniref:F-box protein SKIP23-like n=1 Tax=Silene latifolia TaxID=37657 RepID=UPI003D78A56F
MVGRNPPWSDLPQELLSTIANSLTSNPISILTFRSVCPSWRSSCPPLPNSSLLSPLLPLSIPLRPNSYHYIFDSSRSSCSFLSVTIIYVLQRPQQLSSGIEFSRLLPDTWILFVDEFTPGKLSIRKPFLSASYSTPINFPDINLIDFNVRELGRFHNISYSFNSGYYGNQRSYKLSKPRFCLTGGVNKLVMFPNVSAAITLREDGTLGMYRLNVGINEEIGKCETKHDGKGFRFDDIVEYKGRVLGIDRRGRVYEINYHSSEMTSFVGPIAGGGGRRKRLVGSLGRLYLVVRCKVDITESDKSDKTRKFNVYELNEGSKRWREITSLGDRCFSFGPNFSFSASAQEFGTYMKNCILFVKNSFRTYSGYDDDYKDFPKLNNSELDIGVWHLDDTDHFVAIESHHDHSDSLWPPPSWIWNVDRLKRIEMVEIAINELLFRFAGHLKNKLERPTDSSDTVGQMRFLQAGKVALEAGQDALNLRAKVEKFHEEETEFMHDLRESMKSLNKVDMLFEQSGTSSQGTTKERPELPDNFKTSLTSQDDLLRSTMSMLRKRDAGLFSIEEQTSKVKLYLNSLLGPILTQ